MYVEGHHVRHWADGGETTLRNLVTLCSYHHRFVHEYGYRIVLDALQQPQFRAPDGRAVLEPTPPPPPGEDLGWAAILRHTHALGITADSPACLWDGDRPDYGSVIDELVRLDGLT